MKNAYCQTDNIKKVFAAMLFYVFPLVNIPVENPVSWMHPSFCQNLQRHSFIDILPENQDKSGRNTDCHKIFDVSLIFKSPCFQIQSNGKIGNIEQNNFMQKSGNKKCKAEKIFLFF